MIQLEELKKVCFIGVGGAGMSALARYFQQNGVKVYGYDRTATALTRKLETEGMTLFYEDELSLYPTDVQLVVYTPAIPDNHLGLNFYRDKGYKVQKRAVVLGEICKRGKTIAVAGSHGKTTVSGMIAHILRTAGIPCTAFLGGTLLNYRSNFIHGNDEYFVVEADEFDRSFLQLNPYMAVVTAIDTDHLDVYGTKEKITEAFLQFIHQIDSHGFLLMKHNQVEEDRLPVLDKAFYSLEESASDIYCSKYWVIEGGYLFYINYFGEQLKNFRLSLGGYHNIENAIAAMVMARELGVQNPAIREALLSFKGIQRRFEKHLETSSKVYIDDYAHHPEEISVLIGSVREMYPGRKITAIFQPHLFSRTKDLAAGFAASLSLADEVIVLDIYPARELPVPGVSSALIADKITKMPAQVKSLKALKDELPSLAKAWEVVLTIGAGDIDTIVADLKKEMSREV